MRGVRFMQKGRWSKGPASAASIISHRWRTVMKSDKLIRLALTSAIIAALSPVAWAAATGVEANAAAAQDAQPAGSAAAQTTASAQTTAPDRNQRGKQEKTTTLQTLVVTASAVGVKRLDASYNIVTANREEIRQANPVSVADLLKISPGLWPESTGGQTGANIEIAGFPGGGDAPFNTVQLMGSPLYGMPTLSFFEQTSIFRLDDTVDRVEIIQGGPSVVFADGQIGAS